MKSGVLVCAGVAAKKNIGDYIQSLASRQFFDKVDCYVEREKLKEFSSAEPTKLILHGWFMHNPQQWPPSKDLETLVTSLHIVPRQAESMLTSEGVAYLKEHEPVGCRDYGTLELLKKHNIDAFYSSCLTLTLGRIYMSEERTEEIIFVDPYFEHIKNSEGRFSIGVVMSSLWSWLESPSGVTKLAKRFKFESKTAQKKSLTGWFARRIAAAAFIKKYKSLFTLDELLNATYICHAIRQRDYTEQGKMDYAEELVRRYAAAKLVVTSRIHCALPCLGVETPVLFVASHNLQSSKRAKRSVGRFGGVMELFRVASYTSKGIVSEDSVVSQISREGWQNVNLSEFNKRDFEVYRDALIEECEKFVKNDKL